MENNVTPINDELGAVVDGEESNVIVIDEFIEDLEPYEQTTNEETALEVVSTDLSVVEESNCNEDECSNMGNCKFCDQQMMLPYDSDDKEQRDEAVTLKCACEQAKEYQDQKHHEEERKANRTLVEQMIDKLFEDEVLDCNDDEDLLCIIEEKIKFVKDVTTAVECEVINSATLEINSGLKIVIKTNAKGNLVIERKDTKSRKIEV